VEIAIIGGGIAGLALAIGLHRRGVQSRVFEGAPQVREIGVGITLLPHAMREIGALGLLDAIRASGIETRTSEFYNRFGQKLYSEPRGVAAGYALPEVAINRGKLHSILYAEAVARLGPERIVTDRTFVTLEQDADGVTLQFRETSTGAAVPSVRADLAIGCDGVNSTTRKIFYPDDKVVFTGINTWRGVTRRQPILDGHTYFRIGSIRTGKIVIYPISNFDDGSGDQLVNWVAEIERPSSTMNDWNKGGRLDDFLPTFEGWQFDWLDVGALIRGANPILEYPMVDKDPLKQWTFGRVTLAGDAAHPMYPRGSNGSAQGLIDARTLADLLAAGGDPQAALKTYEAARLEPTGKIVQTNRTSPPDIINVRVEELTGDRPFENLDDHITQAELRQLSDNYKRIAGFPVEPAMAK
jgi:2-polyprenyl-6-methoxyphenol hydroxylase-like FAD-dependent oxidoreductase